MRTAITVMLAGVLLAGCGSKTHSAAPSAAATEAALKGSPAPLAVLHVQASRLLEGGVSAFRARLSTLRGYPIVVNKWASWCDPCQSEFPLFQKASVTFGRRVAFLGDDGNDHDQAARGFLKSFPVSYPSYADPAQRIAASLHAPSYFPETIFIDPAGRIVFNHIGAYASLKALDADIENYALGHS